MRSSWLHGLASVPEPHWVSKVAAKISAVCSVMGRRTLLCGVVDGTSDSSKRLTFDPTRLDARPHPWADVSTNKNGLCSEPL